LNRALAIREAAFDANHPTIAKTCGHLGRLYQTQGKLAEAKAMLERTVGILKKVVCAEDTDRQKNERSLEEVMAAQQANSS
jgi:hypothetical protein